jgi:cytochrome P450
MKISSPNWRLTAAARPWNYPFPPQPGSDNDPRLTWLREQAAMSKVVLPYGGKAWLATRHRDTRLVTSDWRFSRAAALGPDMPRSSPEQPLVSTMLDLDGPEHAALRRMVAPPFGRQAFEALRPRVRALVRGLIDKMTEAGGVSDFTQAFAFPLPVTVIGTVLGVADSQMDDFRRLGAGLMGLTERAPGSGEDAVGQVHAYLARLIARRRLEPSDDLISKLVLARDGAERLTDAQLLSVSSFVLSACFLATAGSWLTISSSCSASPHSGRR